MRRCRAAGLGLALAVMTLLAGSKVCTAQPAAPVEPGLFTAMELSALYRHSPLGSPPPDPTDRVADDPAAAALGQLLFFDTRLSRSGEVACASCHDPARGFADGRRVAMGLRPGTRNSPTILNAAFSRWYFLDGRSDSLWSQALQPVENPKEMGGDRINMVALVAADPVLNRAYQRVFGRLPASVAGRVRLRQSSAPVPWEALPDSERRAIDLVFSNLGKAIEAYERRLTSRAAPFDRYVAALKAGDPAGQRVLSPSARRGLKLFVGEARCELCHSGPAFTDGQFHDLGLPGEEDPGRALGISLVRTDPFNGTGAFSDAPEAHKDQLTYLPPAGSQRGAFKTPSLREIASTAPYMHDGRFNSLARVVSFYAGRDRPQGAQTPGRERTLDLIPRLSEAQQQDLVAFLRTLSSEPLPAALTTPPASAR